MSELNITSGGSYTINESNSTITIATTEPVTLTGNADTQLSEVVISTTADTANLTIDNLNITNASSAIITVGDGSENTLNVTGTNIFEITSGPGACVNVGGGLTINGTGSFKGTSINSAVIGINGSQQKPDSNITIESGTFDLRCQAGACAIGGASLTSVGNITINGNAEVNAINASQVDDSAAIGSGLGSMVQSLGEIVIGGNAKVTATSGLGLAIDNIEYHRENQQYGTTDEGDYPVINENKITIGENATFTGLSGDIYTTTTINGTEFKAAEINYNATDGLTYSGGSELDKEALEETLLKITSGGSYTIAQGSFGKILINTTEAVTLTGGDYDLEEIQIIGQSDNIDLTINDLQITNKAVSESVIKLGSGADNKLTITGDNDFNVVTGANAGVNIGGGLTIGGTGSIKILTLNGAAIGTNGEEDLSTSNIVINSGTFDLQTRSGACGLGGAGNGSKIGNITITGTAHVVSKTPQGYAAAIGSAYRGTVGDILINGDATVEATSGLQSAAIGSAVYCNNGDITIGGRASVIANTTSTDVKDAAIGGTFGEQVASIGDIKIIEDATVIASSAHGIALDNRLYVEGETYASSYWIDNEDSAISISGDTSTANQSTVILTNGNTSDSVIIGNRAYQGGKTVFYDGNLAMTGNWTSLESGGWEYNSVVQMDYTQNIRDDKFANFSLSGGNLKDADGDGIPDGVSIGSIIYVQKSGAHTNVRNLSGNVIYNGDALGVEGDDSYNIEAVSPIDLSEEFPLEGYYITNPHVTAMRLISDGATISPRGDAGTGTVPADWYSFDNADGTVTFMDGSYCVYPESQFFSRSYTKVDISNDNAGVEVTTADALIQKIGNLTDGYKITIESGINVGERINFETSGDGVIVVKTTANTGKYSLDADSDEWQYQRYSIYGGGNFNFVFGENGSVVGMENFDGMLQTNDISLREGEWVTLSGGKFQYTGNATFNPSKFTSFTISGESLNGTENLSINRIMYVPAQDAFRFELNGINGNATIDDVELGISGDSDYSAHFSKINDQSPINIVLMDVSDGATVESNYTAGVDNNGLIKFSVGKHSVLTSSNPQGKVTSIEASNGGDGFELNVSDGIFGTIGGLNDGYAVTINAGDNIGDELTFQTDGGNGSIAIADETLSAGGENNFTVEFDDEGKIIFGRWATIDGGFVYSGHASNNYAKTADVSLIGSELKDTNGDGAPDNITVNAFNYSGVTGVMAFMSGFSGEVTLNGKDVGVIGDDDYEIHFTAKVIENAPANVIAYTNTKEVRGISTGATVNPNEGDMVGFDSNAKAHVGDVKNFYLYNKNHKSGGSAHAQIGIDNNGAGADLTVEDDILTEIGGLNDGYSVTVVGSDNVSDELKFNDVGSGSLEFTSNIDDTPQVNFSGTSSAQSITGSGNSIKLIGSSNDDLIVTSAATSTLTGGAGNDTFRGGVGLSSCVITDYTEGEDIIYHGRPFSDFSINGYISGKDYIFDVAQAGRTITVKDGANKVITVTNVDGETRYFGKYLTLDDNDPATVTAQDGVATIDPSARTADIEIIGNSGDNTIISSAGNCTLTGGKGKDTFIRSSRGGEQTIVVTDFTEDEDEVYHGIPFADFSLLDIGGAVGDDYVFNAFGATIKYLGGANKKIKFVDVNGDVAYFGNYLTIRDVDAATVTASEKVKVLDAAKRTKAIKIIGNTLDNTIYAGKGNSTLTGGDGSDLFVYSAGNDFITDYTEGDKISLGAAITSTSLNGSDVVLMVGTNSLTVQNAKGETLNLIDSSGKEISTVVGKSKAQIISEVTAQASNVESVAADATGTENITLQSGEAAIISKTSTNVNITASAGNDTIISQGENVHVSLTGGNTRIFPLEGRMTLENYDASTGAGFGTTYENIFSAIEDGSIDFNNGRLKLDSARVYMGNSSELMNFYLSDGQQQKVGFTGSDDTLDTSKERGNFLLKGNKRSTITAGSGNDTILAGSRNVVDAGDGRNQIYIAQDEDSTVVMSGKGRSTVHGFNTGYDGDCVKIDDLNAVKFKFDTNGMRLTSNDARLNFDGIGLTTASGGEKILLTDNKKTIRTVVAQDNQMIIVDEAAQAFFGKRSGLNFSDYDEDVNINLSDGTGKLGNWDATFSGFNKLQAGNGMSTLIGDSGRNTLIAGNGYTSIWGNAGNDTLIGKGGSADKFGKTTFFFLAGDGYDVISNFEFLTEENRYEGIDDKIEITAANAVTDVFISDNDVVLQINDSDDYLRIKDAVGKDFRINNLIAKVDRKNLAYDGLANCYVAKGISSLTVDSSVGSAEIWLDSSHGTFFLGEIRTLNASAVDGRTSLVGNEYDNTIIAGQGDSSLWGGFIASNDVLQGGESKNTFFYLGGNGRDTISGINDGDAMILSDISLDQIISTNISADAVSINFIDGGSLQINGSADVTYQLADGSKFSANHQNLEWIERK